MAALTFEQTNLMLMLRIFDSIYSQCKFLVKEDLEIILELESKIPKLQRTSNLTSKVFEGFVLPALQNPCSRSCTEICDAILLLPYFVHGTTRACPMAVEVDTISYARTVSSSSGSSPEQKVTCVLELVYLYWCTKILILTVCATDYLRFRGSRCCQVSTEVHLPRLVVGLRFVMYVSLPVA